MAKDVADAVGTALGKVAREAAKGVASDGRKRAGPLPLGSKGSSPLSGMKGVAAGAGMAALAPLAAKGAGKLAKRAVTNGADPVKKAGEKVAEGAKDAVGKPGDLLPGGGGDSGGKPGVGKGRRMPIQQSVDVAVPLSTAYNQWTQFEEWPSFMHRVDNVSQEDETHVSFKAKIWGVSKEFKAEILDQRPDDRIKWHVTEGLTHSGVVSFHELAPRLTRIEVTLDVEPGSLIEKAARGMRHVKRAVRADLARFKAYIEMEEEESGSWRGKIDDGDVKPARSRKRSSSGSRKRGSSNKSNGSSGRSKAKASSSGAGSRSSSKRRGGSTRGRSSSNAKSRSGSGRKKSSSRSS
jgi:polyketide cyclase/dehydrase/lipid transport protein